MTYCWWLRNFCTPAPGMVLKPCKSWGISTTFPSTGELIPLSRAMRTWIGFTFLHWPRLGVRQAKDFFVQVLEKSLSCRIFMEIPLILLMATTNPVNSPVEVGSFSHYFTGFYTSRVVQDFWTINSIFQGHWFLELHNSVVSLHMWTSRGCFIHWWLALLLSC